MRRFVFAALCALFCLSLASPARAADTLTASRTFTFGDLRVAKYGNGPQTLIFIPGLACGPWEWQAEIARLAPRYRIYALTLPGFDGLASTAKRPLFADVSAEFWALLAREHIVKPILIGHSLGGTLAFDLAEQHPHRLRAIVSVDGLPIFPGNERITPTQRKANATRMIASLATMTHAQFETSERTMVLPYLTISPTTAALLAPLVARSSPRATGAWAGEDATIDLRPQLARATLPILLVAPYDATTEASFAPNAAAVADYYRTLVPGAARLQIVTIDRSRHFIMYDRPNALATTLQSFLGSPQ